MTGGGGPAQQRQEAVGVWIAHELQRGEFGHARMDLDGLDAQQDECRPDEVGELRGQEQRAQRNVGSHLPGAKGESKMSDEHRPVPQGDGARGRDCYTSTLSMPPEFARCT
jgi:hypothetical protein